MTCRFSNKELYFHRVHFGLFIYFSSKNEKLSCNFAGERMYPVFHEVLKNNGILFKNLHFLKQRNIFQKYFLKIFFEKIFKNILQNIFANNLKKCL